MKFKSLNRVIVAIAMMLIGWLPSLAHDFKVEGVFYKKQVTTRSQSPIKVRPLMIIPMNMQVIL